MILDSIKETARKVKNHETTATEIVTDLVNDVKNRDHILNAFASFNSELLFDQAKIADRQLSEGNYSGPLHGIPLGIKDIINVAGYPTRCGSDLYPKQVQNCDAEVINNLRTDGAIFAGKTTSHELACGVTSAPASNPWNTNYVPGGSSGGSGVAVACGYVRATLGSDTGGSIRIPASLCGVVGLKPTYGLVSTGGVEPLSVSLDHLGPITASVEDCALMMNSLVKQSGVDYTTQLNKGITGMRFGILAGKPFSPMQPDVQQAFENAVDHLRNLGATCINIEIPELEHTLAVEFGIIPLESGAYHLNSLQNKPGLINPSIRTLLIAGRVIPESIYHRANKGRKLIASALRRAFDESNLNAVITPSLPATAAKKDQDEFSFETSSEHISVSYVRTTAPFNLSGQPAISVPCGFDTTGLPIGLQVATRPYDESGALRIAHAYATSTEWQVIAPKMG